MKSIYQAIREKFAHDTDEYEQQTLKRLEEKPAEKSRQEALQAVLKEKLEADSKFATQIAELIQDTTEGKPVGEFVTQVFGHARVGKIANFGDVTGNVNF